MYERIPDFQEFCKYAQINYVNTSFCYEGYEGL